jgi:hypothetical protein
LTGNGLRSAGSGAVSPRRHDPKLLHGSPFLKVADKNYWQGRLQSTVSKIPTRLLIAVYEPIGSHEHGRYRQGLQASRVTRAERYETPGRNCCEAQVFAFDEALDTVHLAGPLPPGR